MSIETIILWVSYFACTFSSFYYLSKLFGVPMIKKRNLLLVTVINSAIAYAPVYITNFSHGTLLWFACFLVLGIEIMLLFKQDRVLSLAMLFGYTLNLYATRTLFTGIYSLRLNLHILDTIAIQENRIIISILTFLFLTLYNVISSKFFGFNITKQIAASKASLKLACALLGSVCIIQLITIPTMYVETENLRFNSIYQIRTGILALVSFINIMLLVYVYAKLKEASDTYKGTTAEIKTENLTISKIEAEANTDFFTGFFVKKSIVKKFQTLLDRKVYCYVIYIDLDGLKTVNDMYGHEEGDWYIKTTAKCIKEAFPYETIARIGGDEFLVVGNEIKERPIEERAFLCQERVINLKNENKKPYETSVSYGVIEISEKNKFTVEELIDQADSKMYGLKKARHKERIV